MGLDIVEMVIELEKEFAIDLPDADLRRVETVGQLFALIGIRTGSLPNAESMTCSGHVWARYLDVIERETDLPRSRLVPEARFIHDLGLG
jgi:hypothetical protein